MFHIIQNCTKRTPALTTAHTGVDDNCDGLFDEQKPDVDTASKEADPGMPFVFHHHCNDTAKMNWTYEPERYVSGLFS